VAPGAPAGTRITLDGDPVAPASLGTDAAVDPGKHAVVASVGGAREKRFDVVVGVRGRARVSVEPGPVTAGPAAPAPVSGGPATPGPVAPLPEAPETPRPLRWRLGVAAVSVGGASLIAGLATGVATGEKRAALLGACRPDGACAPSQQANLDAFHALGAVSTTTVIVGGALTAAGVVLLVLPRPAQPAAAWVRPVMSAGMIGLQGGF